jgi:hypothetical protein
MEKEALSTKTQCDITVAFLARGKDGGLAAVEAFLASYARHPAGLHHRLVLLTKGWEGVPGRDRVSELADGVGAEVLDLPDDGYDWGAYFRLANIAKTEFLYLLNTHSRILRDNWVGLLHDQIKRPDIGLVGCTASFATMGWNWPFPVFRARWLWKEGRWLKAIAFAGWVGLRYLEFLTSNRRSFPGFPNPHIRSNAFMLRTAYLREFAAQHETPTKKQEAHHLECGYKGLSRFIEAKGLDLLLCGADGRAHPPSSWPEGGIFCCPNQSNLLVSDNVTREYEARIEARKRDLELLFWGRVLAPYGDET